MWVSVGQLYSAQRLLEWIDRGGLRPSDIEGTELISVLVCPAIDVLNVVSRASWASVDLEGVLVLTVRGRSLRDIKDPMQCLRAQLRDLISADKPVWSKLIPRGRRELTRTAPSEVTQILSEAGLLDSPPTDDVIIWWDEMSAIARGIRDSRMLEVGREGEKLTLRYERYRTNKDAQWQAIESNVSGFDVLSIIDKADSTPLRIEVKASSQKINAAEFVLTRNEWDIACTTGNYVFHLWQVQREPRIAVIPYDDLHSHIPKDSGTGKWDKVKIPFSAFRGLFAQFDSV